MQTQAAAILAALANGETLTPLDALGRFGCFRLAARIKELREAGHAIVTGHETTPNGKRIARYSLPGQARLPL